MKRFMFFLLIVLGTIEAVGQGSTDNPILPRVFEEGYSLEQIQGFANGKGPLAKGREGLSVNYRIKLILIVNKGLERSGEYVNLNNGQPLDSRHIDWIYEHVYRVQNDSLPANHDNTWKNGDQVSDCTTKEKYYGPLDHFKYGVCEIKLDKPSCANLVPQYIFLTTVQEKPIETPKPAPAPAPVPAPAVAPCGPAMAVTAVEINATDSTINVTAKAEATSKGSSAVATTSVVIKVKSSTDKVNSSVAALGQKKARKDRTYVGRNLGWIIPVGAGIVGGVAGFIFPEDGYKWYGLWAKPNQHGTMSNGRGDDGTTNGNGTQDGGRGD